MWPMTFGALRWDTVLYFDQLSTNLDRARLNDLESGLIGEDFSRICDAR